MSEPLLAMDGVVAGYGGGDVLRGVTFGVQEGEITCVVGPNGAGKSTVMRVISGLLKPRLGTVTLRGEKLNGKSPRQILNLGVVQVPQNHSLFKDMTVHENIDLGGYTLRNRSLVAKRIDAVYDLFPQVRDWAGLKAGGLSGGQQRLVEFARALIPDPSIILLDEPSMGLSPLVRGAVFNAIRQMNAGGATVLLVEQNVRAGLKLSHHGVVMENGTVRLEGSGREVLEHPEIGELYLGGAVKVPVRPSADTASSTDRQAVLATVGPQPGSGGSYQPPHPPSRGGDSASDEAESDPCRYLKGQCPESVRAGEPFSVLVSVVRDGGGNAPLKGFSAGPGGRDILLVLHAPGLHVLTGQRRSIHVPPDGDSEPVMFEVRADAPGPCGMSVTAWLNGTYLGELAVETTSYRDHIPGSSHRDFHASVDTTASDGAVSLVVRYDPVQNMYRFEFRDEDNPDEVPSNLAYEPGPRVERLVGELDQLARGRAGFSAAETRDYLREAGAGLWRDLIPEQLRQQFWERQSRISQLTILTDKDTVPWELLYPLDPGHDAGFLVEQFPVTRMVFRRRPARLLSLSPVWFVLPDGSPTLARDEVSELLRLFDDGDRLGPDPVIAGLTPLLELIRSGNFGLLHFACHNAFDPTGGSAISLDRRQFTPTHMNSAAIGQVLAGTSPTVFINACRSAGGTPAYHQLDGWAGKFLDAGAGAFIGTLWAVRDSTARDFAHEMYSALQAGQPLGKAAMQARLAASGQPGDPTWLAYAVYGDPRATLR